MYKWKINMSNGLLHEILSEIGEQHKLMEKIFGTQDGNFMRCTVDFKLASSDNNFNNWVTIVSNHVCSVEWSTNK